MKGDFFFLCSGRNILAIDYSMNCGEDYQWNARRFGSRIRMHTMPTSACIPPCEQGCRTQSQITESYTLMKPVSPPLASALKGAPLTHHSHQCPHPWIVPFICIYVNIDVYFVLNPFVPMTKLLPHHIRECCCGGHWISGIAWFRLSPWW